MHLDNEIDGSVGQSSEGPSALDFNPPSVRIESATFSDGTTVELDPNDVVVLVGPNNAGKSAALFELEEQVAGLSQNIVVRSVKIIKSGTKEDFSMFVERNLRTSISNGSRTYSGYGININVGNSTLAEFWPDRMDILRPLFCKRLLTETRITDSNPQNSIDILSEPPTHPIHLLLDEDTEYRISEYFQRAFGENLIVSRQGGRLLHLLVGQRPIPNYRAREDRVSRSYIERLSSATKPLLEQGDGMRSFASVVLHLLASVTPTILLLDEPEAFLHPPQAKLVGEIIAHETSERAQLIVATHSQDVLNGLVDGASERLRILRIQRVGNVNRVKELDKGLMKRVGSDSLMKYSSVLAGVFHERVIICESDADCLFYSSILDVPDVHKGHQLDVHFVHANGKDRMADLASTLVALDVPVDVIADIDILRNPSTFRKITEALGGDWSVIQPLVGAVKAGIEHRNPLLNSGQIKSGIKDILDEVPDIGGFPKEQQRQIESLFRSASPWEAVKQAGKAAIPQGQASLMFEQLTDSCKQFGLWIVPVGELEGFCRYVGGHGPGWVSRVLENYDLANAPELDDARVFMRDIWSR